MPPGPCAAGMVLALVLVLAPLACVAQAPPADGLRLSVAVSPALPLGAAAKAWADALAADPRGGLAVKLHPGATLSQRDPARELLALRDGGADLAVGSALAWSAQVPALAVYATPWLAPTPAELAAVVDAPDVSGAIARRAEAFGVVVLAAAPLGHRALATRGSPVRAPSDLAGLRTRVTGGAPVVETLAALGARPETMSFAQAQAALAASTLDAQEGWPTSFAAARLPASGFTHVLRWGAFGDAMLFAVRRPVWETWTDLQRSAARETALAVARASGAMASEDQALARLVREGATELAPTGAGIEAFRAASRPAREAWAARVGADLIEAAQRAVLSVPR